MRASGLEGRIGPAVSDALRIAKTKLLLPETIKFFKGANERVQH